MINALDPQNMNNFSEASVSVEINVSCARLSAVLIVAAAD